MKILNLNLWNYNNFEKRKPLIVKFLQEQDPEIITFQEVRDDRKYNSKNNNQGQQINKLLKYPSLKFIKTMDVNKVNKKKGEPPCFEGVATLSKYPFTKSKRFKLKQHHDDKFTRAILWTKLKNIDIFNVHYSPNDLFSRLHLEETFSIAEDLNIHPVIIGDFNIRYPNIVEEAIHKYGNNYISSRTIKNYISYPLEEYTLDYILIPKHIRINSFSCVGNNLSDHKALILDIN